MVGKVRLHYGMSVLPCTQLLSAETLAALTNEHLLCFNDTPDASNYSREHVMHPEHLNRNKTLHAVH